MSYDSQNVFARILRREIPCQTVFESEHTLAFHDLHPQRKVHILVIPKAAYINFSDFSRRASAAEITDFFQSIAQIAQDQGIADSGYRLISNQNADAGQEVPHLHIHLLGGEPLGPMVASMLTPGDARV